MIEAKAQSECARIHRTLNARCAIRAAADVLGLGPGAEVLAPAWNCGSEIEPLLHAGATVRLYRVDARGRADAEDLAARIGPRTKAIYLTRFFGFPEPAAADIRALAEVNGLPLIEDCALSLYDGGSAGDVAVYCFYKFFPVPAGGALRINRPDITFESELFARRPPWGFTAKAIARAGLRRALGRQGLDQLKHWLNRGERAEPTADPRSLPDIPAHYRFNPCFRSVGMPTLTRRILAGLDPAAAAAKRRNNYTGLVARLTRIRAVRPLFRDLPETTVPLACPVLVGKRDMVAEALQVRGIGATPWWAGYHQALEWTDFTESRYLKNHVLALPIHQGIEEDGLDYIAEALVGVPPAPQEPKRPI